MSDTCKVQVNRGDHRVSIYQPCGRPIERDGKCKMHLRVEERRKEKHELWREKQDRGDDLLREAERLSDALGTDVQAYYNSFAQEYNGQFVVTGEWLRGQAGGKSGGSE